jgi:excinuclease ABC subunit A
MSSKDTIKVRGAREHNLKNINIEIPKNTLTVITGLSGSGKSSLAFDTIYAEGQRRYVESLSAYARQFLGQMQKPDVDSIEGLSPAIAIEQKTTSKNPRSTVGTVTEIYDYLRLFFARIGKPHCPICHKPIQPQTTEHILEVIQSQPEKSKLFILAPVIRDQKGTHEKVFEKHQEQGFTKVEVDNALYEIDKPPKLDRYVKHNINIIVDRLINKPTDAEFTTRLTDAIEQAVKVGENIIIVRVEYKDEKNTEKKVEFLFNKKGGCPDHPHVAFEEQQPRSFSFNSPFGACSDCHGLGVKRTFDPNLLVDFNLCLADGCVQTYKGVVDGWRKNQLLAVAKYYKIDIFKPFKELTPLQQKLLLYGDTNPNVHGRETYGQSYWGKDAFEGIIVQHERLYLATESDKRREEYEKYMIDEECPSCHGRRLKPTSLAVTIQDKNIIDVTDMNITDALTWFYTIKLTQTEEQIAKMLLKELIERLTFLKDVGLSYLTLSRSAGTLSGGESQRIRLATQIGSNLTGVLYVLDEPSIGLHQKDNEKLITTLKRLRDIGNTLIVVEHDEDTMLASDFLIDIGPGAGVHGGQIIFADTPDKIKSSKSITGDYLTGKRKIEIPKKRRKAKDKITIIDAHENNLRNVTVDIPLNIMCVISGVSGSGKSTLINQTLSAALHNHFYTSTQKVGKHKEIKGLEKVDKIISIDQSPIGRTPRSNPATYTNVFTDVRELFSLTKEAKSRGYGPGRFSFNVPGGRCENCQGDGLIKIEMNFLPDVYVQCEVCKGKRYNAETLQITYRDKNIADVLDMSVEEALTFFENIPRIQVKMQTLYDVGLGYIKLGQSATTLSGGEAQRIKLTSELAKRGTGKTIYILDEPTTGLHFEDVRKLLEVLNKLVEKGNSILIIEHNLDVIKCADWVIDVGPEGGSGGGAIIAQGTPEDVAKVKSSYTGQFLKKIL